MARSFWNGLVAGSVLGAIIGLVAGPQLKPTPKRTLLGKTRRVTARAAKMVNDVRDGVRDIKNILD
ncbi:MAG: YtxH domain-containing protein [Bacillota bacterium]|uniref:hypothetical protein n=1 Tax=unclassified Carboxydocella TaxID=2685367 RepID=UPI0009ACCBBC|nr:MULTISPECIES: hypothetical protein [unclassified Carboxydocella]AVX30100.1 hypothetical protein CTH_0497 [Carboxydocella thermautotrophica]GAW29555.1 hypothetical protein ULO1_21250 [Carboxydocella sp. ULO1]GAW32859.1 hypothetical protein JDF658_26240 [Carboxydocella sp. JDF658]